VPELVDSGRRPSSDIRGRSALLLGRRCQRPHRHRQLFIWPVLFTLTGFYWRSFRIVQNDKSGSLGLILGYAAFFALLAFWTPPFHSTDLFRLRYYGWLQSHYHMNPYASAVSDVPGWERDPMITETFWRDTACAYGFLFELLARLLRSAPAPRTQPAPPE
jgi:hypothetical protein